MPRVTEFPTLEPDSIDFMTLLVFHRKQATEGGFHYTFEHYPPTFRDPGLRRFEDDWLALRSLLAAHRHAIDAWWDAHPLDGVDLHNAHVELLDATTQETP